MDKMRPPLAAAAVLSMLATGTACQYTEYVCSDGYYPVKGKAKAKPGPEDSNGMCVKDGDPVPRGYSTYGPGKTPVTCTREVC